MRGNTTLRRSEKTRLIFSGRRGGKMVEEHRVLGEGGGSRRQPVGRREGRPGRGLAGERG